MDEDMSSFTELEGQNIHIIIKGKFLK